MNDTSGTVATAEKCTRRLEPAFTENCPNDAAGALKVTLRPAETIEKRWGVHSLLSLIIDLPVCASCLPKVRIMEITDQALRVQLSRTAQRLNNGVLPDWGRTVIEQCAYDDPKLLTLRKELASGPA